MTTFNKAAVRSLAEEAAAALKAVAERHGLSVSYKGGTYADNFAALKFEFAAAATDGAPSGRDADAFRANAQWIGSGLGPVGLKASDLGATFVNGGQTFIIIGYRPRSRFSIIARRADDGKTYKFPPLTVALALGRPQTAR